MTEKWTCVKCGKKYKTYPVVADDNPVSVIKELKINNKFYNKTEKTGLCKPCRKKEYS